VEKCTGISAHVFQIGGQARWVQYHGHLSPLILTPLDIFLLAFVKDNVYFLLLLASVDDPWARIKGTVAEIVPDDSSHPERNSLLVGCLSCYS
jgi:hypothetical protein